MYGPYNQRVTLRVGDILRASGLSLRPCGGADGAGNAIRWVHVSELEDPTPWLRGGELLLTTGMGVGDTPARQRAYLRRLADAGLAGLGFGTGFSFAKVPRALCTAADRAGFPLFEVPYDVPFIAITEAVFSRLSGEQLEVFQGTLEAQGALTHAVLQGEGADGIARVLAAAVRGWALALDLHGNPIAAAPASAAGRAGRLWGEVRAARSEGERGNGFSVSLLDRSDHVALQPIDARGRVEGFLAVGKREPLGQLDRLVASHAVSLLAIELSKMRSVADAERRIRGDFLDALVRGDLEAAQAEQGLRRFGFDPEAIVSVAAVSGPGPVDDLARVAEEVLSRGDGGFLTAPREDHLYLLVSPDGDGWPASLQRAISERLGTEVVMGAGSAVAPSLAGRSFREASYALQICRMDGRSVADFASLGTYRLLLSLQEPDALRAFTESVLAPLDRYDAEAGGELITSLGAFLEHNARWEPASAELFVHRHTLRYRMRKVEELTGRDLASAHDRTEFWLALRTRDLLASSAP